MEGISPEPEMVVGSGCGVCFSAVLLIASPGSLAGSQLFSQLGLDGESQLSLRGWIQLLVPPMPLNFRVSYDPQNHHRPVGLTQATCRWLLL